MKRDRIRDCENPELLTLLGELAGRDRVTTAELLAAIGEAEARRLHRSEGYDSMYRYCLGALRMSEDIAYKRLRVARAARRVPALLDHIANGRLHLSGAACLVPHLTRANADELLAAAADKPKAEIVQWLAERFPQPDLPTVWVPLVPMEASRVGDSGGAAVTAHTPVAGPDAPVASDAQSPRIPGPLAPPKPTELRPAWDQLVPGPVGPIEITMATHATEPLPAFPKVTPIAPGRFALQCTLSHDAHELLRYAQALLGHVVPDGDVPAVLERALRALVEQLERRQFGVGARLRAIRSPKDPRYIAPEVRREVFERDAGRCTFVGDGGHRCESHTRLQFHHVHPFGRGGDSTASNLTLHCGPHNREQAKRDYGTEPIEQLRDGGRASHTEAATIAAVRNARVRGKSPADVLGSRAAATEAQLRLDAMLAVGADRRAADSNRRAGHADRRERHPDRSDQARECMEASRVGG